MNVKLLVAAAISGLLFASFAYAVTSSKLVDDAMPLGSGVVSGNVGGGMSGNAMSGGGMSGSANSMSGNAISGSTNSMNGPGSMSGLSNNGGNDSTPDTATGDNDY